MIPRINWTYDRDKGHYDAKSYDLQSLTKVELGIITSGLSLVEKSTKSEHKKKKVKAMKEEIKKGTEWWEE